MNDLEDFFGNTDVNKQENEPEPLFDETKYSFFDYLNDISFKKEGLAFNVEEITGKFPNEFSAFMSIKAFGNFKDTIHYANIMNERYHAPAKVHYIFYYYLLNKKKRFAKWYKPDKNRDSIIDAVSKYFSWAKGEAEKNIKMLTKEQIQYIIDEVNGDKVQKIKKTKSNKGKQNEK